MDLAAGAGLAALVGVLAAAATGVARRVAIRRAVLDHPDARRAHSAPTPRGGGAGLVAAALAGLAAGWALGWVPGDLAAALAGGGALLGAVGWVDDTRGLSRGFRLAVHALAAGWSVLLLDGMPAVRAGAAEFDVGAAGALVAALGIMWAVNFYNFMDGIDGLAGVEGLQTGLAGGFLFWNLPRARIFMGDAGSGVLGFWFGTLALASENAGGPPALLWGVLLGAFIVDATVTLLRRVVTGERWYQPHRRHAYQRLAMAIGAHLPVTAGVALLNGALAALAWLGTARPERAGPAVLAALLLVGAAYLWVERRAPWAGATGAPDR